MIRVAGQPTSSAGVAGGNGRSPRAGVGAREFPGAGTRATEAGSEASGAARPRRRPRFEPIRDRRPNSGGYSGQSTRRRDNGGQSLFVLECDRRIDARSAPQTSRQRAVMHVTSTRARREASSQVCHRLTVHRIIRSWFDFLARFDKVWERRWLREEQSVINHPAVIVGEKRKCVSVRN